MTGLVSDQVPAGQDWIARRLRQLEREVRELRAERRLEAATIGAGGIDITEGALRIRDGNGDVVVQLGLLPDASYGLASISPATGALVALSTLAFGWSAGYVDAFESTTSSTFDDLSTTGPTVSSVPIGTSGVAAVILSTTIQVECQEGGTTTISGEMSVAVSGASTVSPSGANASELQHNSTMDHSSAGVDGVSIIRSSCTRVVLLTGLNSGSHNFQAKYRRALGTGSPLFGRRTMLVIPF